MLGGTVSTGKGRTGGVGPKLCASSTAATSNLCAPSGRLSRVTVAPVAGIDQAAPSIRYWKRRFSLLVTSSEPVKPNGALLPQTVEPSPGLWVKLVSGGVVSAVV